MARLHRRSRLDQQDQYEDLGPHSVSDVNREEKRMVSPQMLLKNLERAHDSKRAPGGRHFYQSSIFLHPQNTPESRSRALWGSQRNFKESTAWNQCSVSFTGQEFLQQILAGKAPIENIL